MNTRTKITFLLFFLFTLSSFAFRPIGHVILKDQVVNQLPEGNKFKAAMLKYPQVAAWGAIGPDLGYNVDLSRTFLPKWKRQIKNSWQLADLAHYHAVGTFISNLVTEAYSTGDEKLLAFAGGWLTHIAGDFGSHGIYVKPEAGYYIAYEGGRSLHSELEKVADAYLYSKYAYHYCMPAYEFNDEYYWPEFFGIKANPRNKFESRQNKKALKEMLGGVEKSFIKVYKKTFEVESVNFSLIGLANTYSRAVGEGVGKLAGFKQFKVEEALVKIALNNRKNLIDSAFAVGKSYGIQFLTKVIGPTDPFSNEWNLDIGENGAPTFIVRIDAGRKLVSRTKNDLFISFYNGDKKSPEYKITTKIGPMKFAFYQKDTYYYAVNTGGAMGEVKCWGLSNIDSAVITIRPRKRQLFTNYFRIKKASIYYNGKAVASSAPSENLITLSRSRPLRFLKFDKK